VLLNQKPPGHETGSEGKAARGEGARREESAHTENRPDAESRTPTPRHKAACEAEFAPARDVQERDMTYLDNKALDVATETLRPLFHEPVSYLEQAARDCIAAYLTAAPSAPVGELVERLRWRGEHTSDHGATTPTLCHKAAAALTAQAAMLAECERERDEARAAVDTIDGLLNTTAQCAEIITKQRDEARARVEALEKAANAVLSDESINNVAGWYDSVKQLRAAIKAEATNE
jgi:hypothetical protein